MYRQIANTDSGDAVAPARVVERQCRQAVLKSMPWSKYFQVAPFGMRTDIGREVAIGVLLLVAAGAGVIHRDAWMSESQPSRL